MRRPLAAAVPLFLATAAGAQEFHWADVTGGIWFEPTNWAQNQVPPSAGADVFIDALGDYIVSFGMGCDTPYRMNSLHLPVPGPALHLNTGCCFPCDTTALIRFEVGSVIYNNSRIQVNGAYGILQFPEAPGSVSTISGSGVITLKSFAQLSGGVRQLAGHTITGSGIVDIARNDGVIRATYTSSPNNGGGMRLWVDLNDGLISSSDGTTLFLRQVHNSPSGVIDAAGSRVEAYTFGDTVTGGTIRNTEDGDVQLRGIGDVTLEGAGFTLFGPILSPGITNNADVKVFLGCRIDPGSSINGTGCFRLNIWDLTNTGHEPVIIGPDQTITTVGTLVGSFEIRGTLAPEGFSSPGILELRQAHSVLTESALVDIDVFGPGSNERVHGFTPDGITLGGRAHLRFHDYTPEVGDEIQFIRRSGSPAGAFHTLTTEGLDPSRSAVLIYRDTEVVARILNADCPADLVPPIGAPDLLDVLNFLSAYYNGESHADLAPPQGVFDFADVLAYITAFAEGCP